MTHLAIALFFGLLFILVGIAAQMMVREHWIEIVAALRGEMPVRRPAPAPRFTITLRHPRATVAAPRRAAA